MHVDSFGHQSNWRPVATVFSSVCRYWDPDHLPPNGMSILDEVNHRPESRMREIRMSGSEGGGIEPNRSSLPLSCSRRFKTVSLRPGQEFGFRNGAPTGLLCRAKCPNPRGGSKLPPSKNNRC